MKQAWWTAAVAALLVSGAARAAAADELVQPGVALQLGFGGHAPLRYEAALQLGWSETVRRQLFGGTRMPAPALAEWRISSADTQEVRLNGLTIGAGPLGLHAATADDERRHSSWGVNVALGVLATGAAIVGIIAIAGHTADEAAHDNTVNFGSEPSNAQTCAGAQVGGNCVGAGTGP